MHVQSYCFAYSTYCFFGVLVVLPVVASKCPYCCLETALQESKFNAPSTLIRIKDVQTRVDMALVCQ